MEAEEGAAVIKGRGEELGDTRGGHRMPVGFGRGREEIHEREERKKRTRRVRLHRSKWLKSSGRPFASGVAPAARRIIFFFIHETIIYINKKHKKARKAC
jgi:hypothetical protein